VRSAASGHDANRLPFLCAALFSPKEPCTSRKKALFLLHKTVLFPISISTCVLAASERDAARLPLLRPFARETGFFCGRYRALLGKRALHKGATMRRGFLFFVLNALPQKNPTSPAKEPCISRKKALYFRKSVLYFPYSRPCAKCSK